MVMEEAMHIVENMTAGKAYSNFSSTSVHCFYTNNSDYLFGFPVCSLLDESMSMHSKTK